MGFYIRKSIRFGPIRINFSKSGIGLSAGVKGARIGIDSKGRAYTHAGRWGLYHKQFLGGNKKTKVINEQPLHEETRDHLNTTPEHYKSYFSELDPKRTDLLFIAALVAIFTFIGIVYYAKH